MVFWDTSALPKPRESEPNLNAFKALTAKVGRARHGIDTFATVTTVTT